MRGSDADSGLRFTYIRATNASHSQRIQHDWGGTATNLAHLDATTHVEAMSLSRTANSGEIATVTRFKTNNFDYAIQYYYTDRAGNTIGYLNTSLNVCIDGDAPTVSASLTSRDWANTNVSVTLTYSDTRSGVKVSQYQYPQAGGLSILLL